MRHTLDPARLSTPTLCPHCLRRPTVGLDRHLRDYGPDDPAACPILHARRYRTDGAA